MTITRSDLLEVLGKHRIPYTLHEHEAVFTCSDVSKLTTPLPGSDVKNLFLCDAKRTDFVLLCVRADTMVSLKELGRSIGLKGITFGSPKDLMKYLGVTPGSVCVFGISNDSEKKVSVLLDNSLADEELIQNHPLDNTATVVLKVSDLIRFSDLMGHKIKRIDVPAR